MTPRVIRFDRAMTLLVAVLVIALGLLIVDWHYQWVLRSYPAELSTRPASDIVTSDWFPWAFRRRGHPARPSSAWCGCCRTLGRRGPSTLRLDASDQTGRVQADLRSIADAAATRLESLAPLTGVTGTVVTIRSRPVILLRGRIDPAAAVEPVADAAEICARDVAAAFPDDSITCRVLVDPPRRGRGRQQSHVRVQ
ncbi:hypothetical protein NBCG_01880 [Nocardioidaceae bacterium Broad-1]|nr:hypothetical protein NBCG_01880 [Nocardioidaceae bacterium Broad-1]